MHDIGVSTLGDAQARPHMPVMHDVIERPRTMADFKTQPGRLDILDPKAAQAAVWIIETLAQELAADGEADRSALVKALQRRAGYEQADGLYPDGREKLQAELVARLAGRLARI